MTDRERTENLDYCVGGRVLRDMKNMNKGRFWSVMSTNIKRAKKDMQDEITEASTWNWPQTQKKYKG
eukprot:12915096-Prorocentrum_lima.AAC.1